MKKLLSLFALVLTLCSTAMAQDLNEASAVGTVGTLDGREAMVVDLGGSIGKVAVATRNVGAENVSATMAKITYGTHFTPADANDPEKNGLTKGWYVPSKDELDALKSHLTLNSGLHGAEWKVTETATLYLPGWSPSSGSYKGDYVSSKRTKWTDYSTCYIYSFKMDNQGNSSYGADNRNESEYSDCAIRPFHKLPQPANKIYYTSSDGNVVTPHSTDAFGVTITNNSYVNGKGVIEFDGNVTSIGDNAFKGCSTLATITMPEGVVTVGASAFQGCGKLQYIVFPSSVTSIGTSAFSGCDHLAFAKLSSTSVPWTSQTFANCGNSVGGMCFLVPEEAVTDYRNSGWSPTYSSTLSGSGLSDLKGTFQAEINNAVSVVPRLTDEQKAKIETWKTSMMNASDIEAAVNARAQVFLVIAEVKTQIVSYIDEDGVSQELEATKVTSETTTLEAGWHVVLGADVQTGTLVCNGAVHLILADGAKLTATGITDYAQNLFTPGIQVSGADNSLTIYGQTGQTGQLNAFGGVSAAGIGGGERQSGSNITINGGIVTAIGESAGTGAGIGGGLGASGSNITINGGTVTATGGAYGAGIGGGGGQSGSGSNITINGGTVTANSACGAGIGGGLAGSGSNITIKGGTVTANSDEGAGIGGGQSGSGSNITIDDGIVTAASGSHGAGIGGGGMRQDDTTTAGSCSNITINGGTVTATGGLIDGAGIGTGGDATCTGITINGGTVIAKGISGSSAIGSNSNGRCSTITIKGGTITATAKSGISAIGRGEKQLETGQFCDVDTSLFVVAGTKEMLARKITPTSGTSIYNKGLLKQPYVHIEPFSLIPVTYLDENSTNQTANAIAVSSSTEIAYWYDGWYVVQGEVSLSKGVICNGSVNLILADGAKLTATGGIGQSGIWVSGEVNSLTIYGQSAQSGQLIANGGDRGAGIGGGGYDANCYNITINGGIVVATGGKEGAGIGGSTGGSGNNITINGGSVTANGGEGASGIGGGLNGSASNIKIAPYVFLKADGNNPPATVIVNTGADLANDLAGKRYVTAETQDYTTVSYIDENGIEKTAYAYELTGASSPVAWGVVGKTTWYVVTGEDVQLSQGAVCHGDVRLILADGAKVTVTGEESPNNTPGIEVSGDGNSLTIYGQTEQSGQLEANGGDYGAGIGGGYQTSGSNITINGGTVTANGGADAAGIGGGNEGNGYNITINGGTVTANGGEEASGIGGGLNGSASNIKIAPYVILKADGNNPPATVIVYTGADLTNDLAGKRYVTAETQDYTTVSYIDENGIEKTSNAYELTGASSPVAWGAAGKTTWYVVTGEDVQLSQGAVCHGDVRLILADGAKLTATGADNQAGISVTGSNNSFTIYGQTAQSGQLIANGAGDGAGIGGGNYLTHTGSNITIKGGIITATGGPNGAGIGGGSFGSGYNITIAGGIVTAIGGTQGAGVGGGYRSYGRDITITGGTVTAIGGESATGIGRGHSTSLSSNITVSTILTLKAGSTENSIEVITNTGGDLAGSLVDKQYVTITDEVCNITANQDPDDMTHYYSTFYSSKKAYSVPEGVTAYTGVAKGDKLQLTPIADDVIPAGEAVILRTTQSTATDSQVTFALTATTTTATKSDGNMLQGSDESMTLPSSSYALSLGQNGVGFYDFSGKELPANKAYLTLAAASSVSLRFSFGDATDIDAPDIDDSIVIPAYNLQGQQVDDSYRGIVIINGKKVLKR